MHALEFLENVLSTPSPTGFEKAGQQVWLNYVKTFSDSVETDVYGSAVARISTHPKAITVMLEAHADEIGMMVNYISEKGFIYVTRVGGSDPSIVRAKRVFIHAENGIVAGIVGNTAIHLQDRDNKKTPEWKDIFIDIGAKSKEEALELVRVGDPITFVDDVEFLNDEIITGRALDNRIGGYMIARVMENLAKRKEELNVNVIALNAVQEEIGGHGARMNAYRLHPDVALVTDVTHSTDTPGINVIEHGDVRIGGGPAITHGSANHPEVVRHILKIAKKHDIPVQHEATSLRTGTDTDSIFHVKGGIASGLISLPLRYMHSPVEMAHISDIEHIITLMTEFVLSLKKDHSFKVFG